MILVCFVSSESGIVSSGRGRPATRKDVVAPPPINTTEDSLYAIVKNGRAALAVTVDDWIDQYKGTRGC